MGPVSSRAGSPRPARRVPEKSRSPEGARTYAGGALATSLRPSAWNDPLRRRMLAGADLLACAVAVVIVAVLGDASVRAVLCAAVIAPVWAVIAKAEGLYDFDHTRIRHLTIDEVAPLFHAATASTAVVALLFAVVPGTGLPPHVPVLVWASMICLPAVFRGGARTAWRRLVPPERTLVVGEGPIAGEVGRKLAVERDHHLAIACSIDPRDLDGADAARWSFRNRLAELARTEEIERVIVAVQELDEPVLDEVLAVCRSLRLKMSLTPPIRAMLGTAVSLTHLGELPMIEFRTWDASRSTMLAKRAFDLAVAVPTLVLTAPLMLVVALLIRLDSRGPALFVQDRAGRLGAAFKMIKFRTMVADAEERLSQVVRLDALPEPVFKVRSDPRVTRMGRILRRTSLDELPQLLNVVMGHMSLVGPRPEELRLVMRYSETELVRLQMRPGMTGPMQVHGRGELTFRERLALEREYIENYSLRKDIHVLLRTVSVVFRGHGAF